MHEYHEISSSRKTNFWRAGFFVTLVLLIGLAIFTGVWIGTDDDNSSEAESRGDGTCNSQACLELANSILVSINPAVDPCDDFFQYACGGWIDEAEWQLVKQPTVNSFSTLDEYEKQMFLDSLFYNPDSGLTRNSAVNKSAIFYQTCYMSQSSQEEVTQSAIMQEFIQAVNFTNSANARQWDTTSALKFQQALGWLGARGWNTLFSLNAFQKGTPFLTQDYQFWLQYTSAQAQLLFNSTLIPLFQTTFGLNETESQTLANEVIAFANSVKSITTADSSYLDQTTLRGYLNYTTNLALFGTSSILNYSNVMLEQFAANSLKDIMQVFYYNPDVSFFQQLIPLVESTAPEIVQYYIFSNVMVYTLNFDNLLVQSRYQSRTDYCFDMTVQEFPYVYGHVTYARLYTTYKYQQVTDMVNAVINNGVQVLIEQANWMDETSRENCNEKIEHLARYVGFPDPIQNGTTVSQYYGAVVIESTDYMQNLENLLNFDAIQQQQLFAGTNVDMTGDWPADFSDPSQYPYWLTGINAFYSPEGNFFVIPTTITQQPFYSPGYPSSINFGGIGGVIGHEISHGFDPQGSMFNENGTYVPTSIWTNSTREQYLQRVQCIINQYNGLEVEPGVYVNGTLTQTENVADNSGIDASYLAWVEWRKGVSDPKLPGVNMTDEQLFFMGWARSWCQAAIPGYYSNWTNVHAPNIARVWGVVQNSPYFAQAFNCPASAPMNPNTKCDMW